MTAEQARREDEEYFNRTDAYINMRCCEDCKDDSDPLYDFYGHRFCKFCIRTRLKDWSNGALLHEIATADSEEIDKEDMVDLITDNLEAFYE